LPPGGLPQGRRYRPPRSHPWRPSSRPGNRPRRQGQGRESTGRTSLQRAWISSVCLQTIGWIERATGTQGGRTTNGVVCQLGEGAPSQALVGLDVARPRPLHDVGWQVGGRRLAVPALDVEPVPEILLVEGRGVGARLPLVCRPEAGGVGGEDLVGQRDLAI